VRQGPEHGMSRPRPVPCGVSYQAHPRTAQASWAFPGLTGEGERQQIREVRPDRTRSRQDGPQEIEKKRARRNDPSKMIEERRIGEMKMSRGAGRPKTNAGRSGRRYSVLDAACRLSRPAFFFLMSG
jgi:hypothetical protein